MKRGQQPTERSQQRRAEHQGRDAGPVHGPIGLEHLRHHRPGGERAQAVYCAGLSALKLGKREEAEEYFRTLKKEYPGTPLAAAAAKIMP